MCYNYTPLIIRAVMEITRLVSDSYFDQNLVTNLKYNPDELRENTERVPVLPEYVTSVGYGSLLSLPLDFYEAIKNLILSIKNFDTEASIQSSLKIINIPFGIITAIERTIFVAYLFFQGISLTFLYMSAFVAGCIFLSFELAMELMRLIQLIIFYESNNISWWRRYTSASTHI